MITSLQNEKIKEIVRLSKPGERKARQMFVIEGFREIQMASQAGYEIQELYYCSEVNLHPQSAGLFNKVPLKTEVSRKVFEKIAYRQHSDGLIALAVPEKITLNQLRLSENPLVLVLESVEKPGNLGALLRTADAASIDALIVCDPQTDLYNPNVIRSSLGCLFSQQVVTCSTSEAIHYLKEQHITTYAAALTASAYYHESDLSKPCALVMGTESTGLSNEWLQKADRGIKIPMRGRVDSLNVSVSAAVLVFEAMRQRGFT